MFQRLLSGSMLPGTVFLLFLALISVILHSMYEDRVRGNLEEVYQKRAADRVAFECADVANEGLAYCRNEVQELEARRLQEHLGLYAQQSMAAWSFGMLMTSMATVLVTAIGIYFLRETLNQTAAANRAAQEAVTVTRLIGERQLRAYVNISKAAIYKGDDGVFTVGVVLRNYGQSPATRIMVGKLQYDGSPVSPAEGFRRIDRFEPHPDIAPQQEHTIYYPLPDDLIERVNLNLEAGDPQIFRIVAKVVYTDVFEKSHALNLSYTASFKDSVEPTTLHMDVEANFSESMKNS